MDRLRVSNASKWTYHNPRAKSMEIETMYLSEGKGPNYKTPVSILVPSKNIHPVDKQNPLQSMTCATQILVCIQ